MAKQRKAECSLMAILFCFMVIFIHVSSVPVLKLNAYSWQHLMVFIPWKLFGVAVYGFIFLSGLKLFLSGTDSFSAGKFYRRRFVKILIPYVIWIVVYYLYYVDQEYYPFQLSQLLEYLLTGEVASQFYFIVILIQFYGLMPLWVKIFPRVRPVFLLAGSLVITVLCYYELPGILGFFGVDDFRYNDRLFTSYLFFWTAGCCAGMRYDAFTDFVRRRKIPIVLLFAALAVAEIAVFYQTLTQTAFFRWDILLHYAYCTLAILLTFLLSLGAASRKWTASPWFRRLDYATFSIYLSHILIMNIVDYHIAEHGIWAVDVAYAWRFLFTYLIAVGGCLLYVFLKEKGKVLLLFAAEHKK